MISKIAHGNDKNQLKFNGCLRLKSAVTRVVSLVVVAALIVATMPANLCALAPKSAFEKYGEVTRIFDESKTAFLMDEDVYYKVYMSVRSLIFHGRVDREGTLGHIRKLAEGAANPREKRFCLMVWAKLEEDRITDNLDLGRPLYKAEYMTLCLTNQCDLECEVCYSKSGPHKREKLTMAQIHKVLLQAKRAGIKEVIFQGGEPLLVADVLIEAIKAVRNAGLQAREFSTNGRWICQPGAKELLWRLKEAFGTAIPKMLLSVDKIHQKGSDMRLVKDFIDTYFELFPGKYLQIHSFETNDKDELEDLILLLKKEIRVDAPPEGIRSRDGERLREIVLRKGNSVKGDLRITYRYLWEIGRARHMPGELLARYQTRPSFEGRESEIFKPSSSPFPFLAGDIRRRPVGTFYELAHGFDRQEEFALNSFALRWDGEYFVQDIFVGENVFSLGNIGEKSVEEAYRYADNNPVIHTLNTAGGHAVVYRIAKQFNPGLPTELGKYHVMEELMIGIIKDPIERLAITCKLLEKFKKEKYAKSDIGNLGIDWDFIYQIRKENSRDRIETEISLTTAEVLKAEMPVATPAAETAIETTTEPVAGTPASRVEPSSYPPVESLYSNFFGAQIVRPRSGAGKSADEPTAGMQTGGSAAVSPGVSILSPQSGIAELQRRISGFIANKEAKTLEIVVDGTKHQIGKSTFVDTIAAALQEIGWATDEAGHDYYQLHMQDKQIKVVQIWGYVEGMCLKEIGPSRFTIIVLLADTNQPDRLSAAAREEADIVIDSRKTMRILPEAMMRLFLEHGLVGTAL